MLSLLQVVSVCMLAKCAICMSAAVWRPRPVARSAMLIVLPQPNALLLQYSMHVRKLRRCARVPQAPRRASSTLRSSSLAPGPVSKAGAPSRRCHSSPHRPRSHALPSHAHGCSLPHDLSGYSIDCIRLRPWRLTAAGTGSSLTASRRFPKKRSGQTDAGAHSHAAWPCASHHRHHYIAKSKPLMHRCLPPLLAAKSHAEKR